MLEVYNRQRKLIGILQNAFNIREELKINSINHFQFSLPGNDSKNELCQQFNYIRYNNGDYYRIMPKAIIVDEKGNINYRCEHVLALLIDQVLFGQHVIGNIGVFTRNVIEWLLDKQNKIYNPLTGVWTLDTSKSINWRLGECDFARQFEYGWEQETILSALFSVARPFVDNYMWTFNTHSFPYILNLKRIDENINPQMYIRAKKNLIQLSKTSDPTTLCTRIYPLGEGEGINQMTIRDVNNGIPYLQSPAPVTDKYDIVERIWIDRRYTDAQSLKDAAYAMLNELQEPFEEYLIDFTLLRVDQFDMPEIGKVVEIVDFKKSIITGIEYDHDELKNSLLFIANKPKDIAGTVAEMMDRQRIEMAYAQGATQFYERDAQGNADPNIPLTMKLYIPDGLKIINFVKLDIEVGSFRKPFRVTAGGGGQTISQSDTTSSGASTLNTTQSGGGETSGASSINTSQNVTVNSRITRITPETTYFLRTSTDGDPAHRHEVESHSHPVVNDPHSHGMAHTHNLPLHTHGMSHTHSIAHTHNIGNHVHDLNPGVEYSGNPSSFKVFINGVEKIFHFGRTLNIDISKYLVNNQNVIPRNTYFKIEILPDDAAHILMTVSLQGFIQSRGQATL